MKNNISAKVLLEMVKKGNNLAAAKLISLIVKENETAKKIIRYKIRKKQIPIAGITGAPGAGKSTLIDKIIHNLRRKDKKIGVILCDPKSPISGGAFLGDRVRMQGHSIDEKVFIRSMTADSSSLVAKQVNGVIKIFTALGKDFIIIETVGGGQQDFGLRKIVKTLVLVLTPESGDDIQLLKSGVLETADVIVVNKQDRDEESVFFSRLQNLFGDSRRLNDGWQPILLKTCATASREGEGIEELTAAIMSHFKFVSQN